MDLHELETELKSHEAMCEERWKSIFSRVDNQGLQLERIESRMTMMGGTIIMFLLGIISTGIPWS